MHRQHFGHEIHGDVPRLHDLLVLLFGDNILFGDVEVFADGGDHAVRRELFLFGIHVILQRLDCDVVRDLLTPEERGVEGHPIQKSFHLPNVGFRALRDEVKDSVLDVEILLFRLFAQDCEPCLEFGGLNVRDESALKAGAQPVRKFGQIFGRAVGGHDNLFAVLV